MIVVSKSRLRKASIGVLAAGLLAALVAGVALASSGDVQITSPSLGDFQLVKDDGQLVGVYPIYSGQGITLDWPAYSFADGANGSYFVQLWQNTTPLADTPTWVMRKAAHHFADNPAGTSDYLMGPFFNSEQICALCPSVIVVQLETYTLEDGVFHYTPFGASLTAGKPQGYAESGEFVLQPTDPEHKSPSEPVVCDTPNQSRACCEEVGGDWNGESCEFND